MSDEMKELWSDLQIAEYVSHRSFIYHDDLMGDSSVVWVSVAADSMARVRDDVAKEIAALRAQVAELEAQLEQARHWLPESVLSGGDEEDANEKHIGSTEWVGPSGRAWKVDLYQGDEGDDE